MHVVIWTCKGQRYATPSSAIVEVIPVVQSRPIPGSETWLTGLFDYRGLLLPLLDSSRLLDHNGCEIRMSSRIIVIRTGEGETKNPELGGFLVEHVLGAERLEFEESMDESATYPSGIPFLGPVALTNSGTVQLMLPSRLPMARQ